VAGTIARERRASARVPAPTLAGMERARLRPGRTAHVVDLSAGGALLETDWRILPGMRVEMQLGEPAPLFRVAGRVLRCHVTLVDRERIRYRCALMFEEHLPFGELPTQGVGPGT
jgi:hypothetical protein